MNTLLIFPNQLYYTNTELAQYDLIVLFEDPMFFFDARYRVKFHKQKLVLHRASMKSFWSSVVHPNKTYVEWASGTTLRSLLQQLSVEGIEIVYTADPVDTVLEKRLRKFSQQLRQEVIFLPNQLFLNTAADNQLFLDEYPQKKLHFTQFYIFQRKRLGILLNAGKPLGGKWSYDADNRKKLPKNITLPVVLHEQHHAEVVRAQQYVEKHFEDHVGVSEPFFYPVTRSDALAWLEAFVTHRLDSFGMYEDAMDQKNHTLFHSLLSPLLNIGLITPQEVVDRVLQYTYEHPDFSLNAVEGFLRQVIGWREYVRLVYEQHGTTQRNANALGHHRRLNKSWYTGDTQLVPVDEVIRALHKTAYLHHIERLMVLGNAMALCEIEPDQVYTWFMEMFIDAYDWVMVPNVYGMSQYADGGLMTTKPYVSSSNYLLKMSNYQKGSWTEVWDGLFWRCIHTHRDVIGRNIRMQYMITMLQNMDEDKKQKHFDRAEAFINAVTTDHS